MIRNLGNGMCHVMCIDGILRLCHIRGKFQGKRKRDNTILLYSWVLVGIRDYETITPKKLSNCDLLEVYNETEKEKLKMTEFNYDWSIFQKNEIDTDTKNINNKNDDNIKFIDNNTEEYCILMEKQIKNDIVIPSIIFEDNEEIDIDDI